ncbi:MAG: SH3 domain-containing protein [Rhodobacteraceae bacterium]|nr:SH3 domain-containing protein [Paracoccaceae bacterium]
MEITNVPLNDTLNLRAGPSGSSADIGDLYNGDLVEVLGIQGNWGMIGRGEGDAWISLTYTKEVARPALSSGLPVGLGCSGTEPFWSLNLLKIGAISISGASQPILQSGVSRNSSIAYFFSTSDSVGVLRAQQCSDGMSDRTYGWQIDVVSGQELFSGCCSIR